MTTHETVRKMTDGQRGDIVATMAGAIPSDLTFEEAKAITGMKGPFVVEIRKVFAKRRRQIETSVVPADGELFDLEVDNTRDPMEVVTSAGYDANGWRYLGPEFTGKQILRVKLVRLGYVRNLKEAEDKAAKMGCRLVQGQARESFKTKFPKAEGNGLVVFGGSEWRHPDGAARVACLGDFEDEWHSDFDWSADDFLGGCRWLVVGK